jgi:neogenin
VLEVGSSATLDCAANGNPIPFITWLKDGATVDLSHLDTRFAKVGAGSLHITNVAVEDEGVYQCRAENSEDSLDSAAALTVQVSPRLLRKPENERTYVTSDVELVCEVFAVPEATVQWYKNGELLVESDYFQVEL